MIAVLMLVCTSLAIGGTFIFDSSLTYNRSPNVTITHDQSGHSVFTVQPEQGLSYFFPTRGFGPDGDDPIVLQGSLLSAWIARLDPEKNGGTVEVLFGGYERRFELGQLLPDGTTVAPLLMIIPKDAVDVSDVGFQIRDLEGSVEISGISFTAAHINPVPEPATYVLMGVGMLFISLRRKQIQPLRTCLL